MRRFAISILAAAVLAGGCGDDASSERQAGAERRAPSPASPGPSAGDRRALMEAQELIASCRTSTDVTGQLPGAVAIIESLAQFHPGDETVRGAAGEARDALRACGERRLARRVAAAAK